ncbi:hypothetical protein [Treponema porcinum]|uniref:Uncharacterized protein n=1 Tax=Treponema porcinum TaxID=261392 RepID=A0A1T4KJ32_TREPO|nr:hypothetical protein [Treponema porcinum]SJZ42386.1 hypothetical protein SAMN02745149_01196 [Treponema porcinum]
MDAEENVFGRAGFYGWAQKKIFLGVQDFTDGRRRKSFWACRILRMDVEENLFGRAVWSVIIKKWGRWRKIG